MKNIVRFLFHSFELHCRICRLADLSTYCNSQCQEQTRTLSMHCLFCSSKKLISSDWDLLSSSDFFFILNPRKMTLCKNNIWFLLSLIWAVDYGYDFKEKQFCTICTQFPYSFYYKIFIPSSQKAVLFKWPDRF